MCKAGFADDDFPRAMEDGSKGSGTCKAGLADGDAPRVVEDGSGMCKPGFADDNAPVLGRSKKPMRPKKPGTTDDGMPKVPGITPGMNQKVCASDRLIAEFAILAILGQADQLQQKRLPTRANRCTKLLKALQGLWLRKL